jgi:hypothetical protein
VELAGTSRGRCVEKILGARERWQGIAREQPQRGSTI